jgi:hypothetical protein
MISEGKTNPTGDPDYQAAYSQLPHQYRAWRQEHAERVFAEVADLMFVRCDNPNVIINVVEADGEQAVVVVNDFRMYGRWTAERGYQWCDDQGKSAKAVITIGQGFGARSVPVLLRRAQTTLVGF